MTWRLAVVAVIAIGLGALVLSNLGYRKRRQERAIMTDRVDQYAAEVESGRYVDIGVTLHTVVADPNGEELIEGKPKLRVIRKRTYGGMLDTKRGCLVPAKSNPIDWFCSVDQETVVLHSDDGPLGQLVKGSEGSGKSSAISQWIYFRWLELLGEDREIGCAAPTEKRIKMVQDEVFRAWPKAWWKYRSSTKLLKLADGTRVQFVSTTQTSAKGGSPVQGYNWSAAAQDELQDQVAVFDDIGSRGRASRDGRYKQIGSCTAKEDPGFRSLCARILNALDGDGNHLWAQRTMLIANSPFIAADFLQQKRSITSEREFRRRYLAEDLPPEQQVYFCWSRGTPADPVTRQPADLGNLRPIPLGARKVTSIALRAKLGTAPVGQGVAALLAGHDPGTAKSGTVFLDAFEIAGTPGIVWFVRGEIYGQHQTTEQSALAIIAKARTLGSNHRPDTEQVHVRAQPVGQSEDKPDADLYKIFKRLGLDVRAAQYRKDGKATGVIKKDTRIDMINRLLCDANGVRRLFVECDDRRIPVAPKLVESLEMAERDHEGRAETDKKNVHDTSDMPSALGYALWPFEKESSTGVRDEIKKGLTR